MFTFKQRKQRLISAGKQFLYFTQFIRPYWKKQVLVILLTQLTIGLNLVNPYLSKLVIDRAYKNKDLQLFIILAIIGGSVFLLNSLVNHITAYQRNLISKQVDFDFNRYVTSGLYDLNLKFFRDTSKTVNFYKLNYDIHSVSSLLVETFFQIFQIFPAFLFTFIIVTFLNWKMALMAFSLGIFSYLHAVFFLKKRRKIILESIEKNQSIFGRLNEVLSKMYLIKASGESRKEKKRFLGKLREAFAISLKSLRLQMVSGFSSDLVNKFIIGIITFFGGYQIISGQMTLGTLTAIMVYLSRITGFHFQVSSLFQQMGTGLISCERLQSIMEEIENQRKRMTKKRRLPVDLAPHILFKDVDFYYYPRQWVLKGFNMQIEPYQIIGLVGSSGCGKSTVINLLLGLYYPVSGKVLIEGIPTDELDLESVRRRIGVVLQEPFLWNTSLKENLLYFSKSGDDEIDKVIEVVRLKEVIKEQPAGMDTNLGDDACKLSEGQKQRLSLARALLRKPKLLILDEALSFVDNQTSADILKNIRIRYPSTTILVITHNPKLLNYTQKVVFMRENKEVTEGLHQDLLKETEYKKLLGEKN